MHHPAPILALAAAGLLHAAAPADAQSLPPVSGTTYALPTAAEHTLFVPSWIDITDNQVDVLVHFHGSPDTIHRNAGHAGLNAVILNVNYAGLSSAYSTPFSDADLFGDVLDGALNTLNSQRGLSDLAFDSVSVSSFSAGFGAVREILKQPAYIDRIDGLLLADTLYASFTSPTDLKPLDSQMAGFRTYAQAAAAGSKTMIVSHSQVQTFTYSNTAETADDLMATVGVTPTPTNETGLGTLSFYRKAQQGNFSVWGAAGSNGDAHLEHLRYIGEWLDDLPTDRTTTTDPPPDPSDDPIVLADFETDEAPFDFDPLFSGSNVNIAAATAQRVTTTAHTGDAAQRLDITRAPGRGNWLLRHTAAGGFPSANTSFGPEGWISVWAMTTTPGNTIAIGLDDPDSADLSTALPLSPDGTWRLYQWKLDDPDQWAAWADGDGTITGPTTTVDALFLTGSADATIYLDDLVVSPTFTRHGLLGDATLDQAVDTSDLAVLAANFGQSAPATWHQADFNGDGLVNTADLAILAANFGNAAPASPLNTTSPAVPEPTGIALLSLGLGALTIRRIARSFGLSYPV
ncbi:MAG: dockerin type I domain-containing protein [Planctomycetota bacterium]